MAALAAAAPPLSKSQQKKEKERRQKMRKMAEMADAMYKGRRCFVSKNGNESLATVVKVHRDDPEEMYITVADDAGRERQTLLARTRPATDEEVEAYDDAAEDRRAAADAEAAKRAEAERRKAEDALVDELGDIALGDGAATATKKKKPKKKGK